MVSFPQANTHGSILTGTAVRSWIEVRRRLSVVVVLLLSGHARRWPGTLRRRGRLLGALAREVLWPVRDGHDERHGEPQRDPQPAHPHQVCPGEHGVEEVAPDNVVHGVKQHREQHASPVLLNNHAYTTDTTVT